MIGGQEYDEVRVDAEKCVLRGVGMESWRRIDVRKEK